MASIQLWKMYDSLIVRWFSTDQMHHFQQSEQSEHIRSGYGITRMLLLSGALELKRPRRYANRINLSLSNPSSRSRSERTKHSTVLDWLNMFLNTRAPPNRNTSESSVMIPSTSSKVRSSAHWASASIGAVMYGMPKSRSMVCRCSD